jgi:hypothetical protein
MIYLSCVFSSKVKTTTKILISKLFNINRWWGKDSTTNSSSLEDYLRERKRHIMMAKGFKK